MIPVFRPMPMSRRFSSGQLCVHLVQHLHLLQSALARQERMVGLRQRRPPEAHDFVTDVLVQRPLVVEDQVRHGRQVQVEVVDQLLRGHAFGQGREPADIGEEHRELLVHAAQLGGIRPASISSTTSGLTYLPNMSLIRRLSRSSNTIRYATTARNDRKHADGGRGECQDVVVELEHEHEDEKIHDDRRRG